VCSLPCLSFFAVFFRSLSPPHSLAQLSRSVLLVLFLLAIVLVIALSSSSSFFVVSPSSWLLPSLSPSFLLLTPSPSPPSL